MRISVNDFYDYLYAEQLLQTAALFPAWLSL